jgi:hypothetical protein
VDLIAATHGRSFWTLDDITPLRQLSDSIRKASTYLFAPSPAQRFSGGGFFRAENAAPNPPAGLYLDYWFKSRPTGQVTLTFMDSAGKEIRTYKSDKAKGDSGVTDSAVKARIARRERVAGDSVFYYPADSVVSARAGGNRFIWSLNYPGAKKIDGIVDDEGFVDGPVAPPGRYSVRIVSGKDTLTRSFTIIGDPRVKTTAAGYAAQFALEMRVHDAIDSLSATVEHIASLQRQLDERTAQTASASYAKKVADAAKALRTKLETIRAAVAEVNSHADEITLVYPVRIYNQLLTMNAMAQGSDDPPTSGMMMSMDDLAKQLQTQRDQLAALEKGEVAAFNSMLAELKVAGVN